MRRYFPSRHSSTQESMQSIKAYVTPHAKSGVRPIAMPGKPGKLAPMAYLGPAFVQRITTSYQIGGSRLISRCGSLHRNGLPDAVLAPATTQLLEAIIRGNAE